MDLSQAYGQMSIFRIELNVPHRAVEVTPANLQGKPACHSETGVEVHFEAVLDGRLVQLVGVRARVGEENRRESRLLCCAQRGVGSRGIAANVVNGRPVGDSSADLPLPACVFSSGPRRNEEQAKSDRELPEIPHDDSDSPTPIENRQPIHRKRTIKSSRRQSTEVVLCCMNTASTDPVN